MHNIHAANNQSAIVSHREPKRLIYSRMFFLCLIIIRLARSKRIISTILIYNKSKKKLLAASFGTQFGPFYTSSLWYVWITSDYGKSTTNL